MSIDREPKPRIYSRVAGTGSALPKRCVDNQTLVAELAQKGIETSDEWIVARTGIRQRYLAEESETTVSLAEGAARKACEAAGVDPSSLDLIIVATSTPDFVFPSSACLLQARLGATGGAAFDIQAVCSGFVYALTVADRFIASGAARNAMVIGSEVFSRILDWSDRGTCVLFGDGAGAVLLQPSDQPGIISQCLHADGRHASILQTPGQVAGGRVTGHPFLTMDGQAVFKLAVTVLDAAAREVLEAARMAPSDVNWLIPHQANIRILQSTAKKLGLRDDQVVATVDVHGNTSAASVPLALDVAVRDGRVQRGHYVLLEGVGGGFTWGAVLLRY